MARYFETSSFWAASAALILGLATLVGWLFDLHPLKYGLSPEPMRSWAALSLLFCASALLLTQRKQRTSLQEGMRIALAGITLLINAMMLTEYLFSVDLGVDRLLPYEMRGDFPGRLPLNTALSFALFGGAIIIFPKFTRWAKNLAIFSGLLSVVASLGYLLKVPELYGYGSFAFMSSTAAVGVVLLFFAVVFIRPSEGFSQLFIAETMGGYLLRRLIVFVFVISPATIILMRELQEAGLVTHDVGTGLGALIDILILVAITWFLALKLDQIDRGKMQAEADLRQSHNELEMRVAQRTCDLTAANQELEAFAYSVSHDLRTPLRGIDGFSKALLEDYNQSIDETGKRYLGFIRSGTQQMGKLIDALLALSRLSRMEMKRENVDLSAIAHGVIESARKQDPARKVKTIVRPGLVMKGDPELLKIVLDNLIGNAWKFTSQCEEATIEFGENESGLFVRDNGAGFDMAYANKLFGAFQRLHGNREFPGTGIGLTTVKRIITRHGGKVWADGATGKGATFYFSI
ncbi:MAG: hypothetical protein A2X86_07050 [Bdellovibrionales bacterium GWA2_49_15]|nr:MAG: hypothetical protein A2X86_07050 [Bdellovibrionales bacterium GWA2_49_15]HAZ11967.1 hypothetical protein [Bdellovibrionales bacterium]